MPEENDHNGLGVHWDKFNRPVGYIIGTSPGFAQFGQGEERLINMGLGRKIVKAARLGFDFAMIDYETLSEMYEKDVEKLIAHVKEVQKIEVGLHLPVKLDLCISNSFEWKEMHEILRKGAYSAKTIVGAKFILFHTSSRIRPHVTFTVGHQEASVQQNSFNGMNLGQWMDNVDDGKFVDPQTEKKVTLSNNRRLRDWFMAKFIKVLFHVIGYAGDVGTITFFDELPSFEGGTKLAREKYTELQKELSRVIDQQVSAERTEIQEKLSQLNAEVNNPQTTEARKAEITREARAYNIDLERINSIDHRRELSRIYRLNNQEFDKEFKKYGTVVEYVDERVEFNDVFNFWVRKGSECEEQVAYRVTAKYMFWTNDPLWTDIVGAKYDPDVIIKCADESEPYYDPDIFTRIKGLKKKEKKEDKPNEKERTTDLVKKLITAVACKYIQGHIYTEGSLRGMRGEFPDDPKLKDESAYKYCRAANIQIYIETAMPPEGQEGELRIMSAHDHVTLAKHLDGGEFTSYTMDFEHLTVNFVRVSDDIESLKDGDGKYIRMMHINAPRPVIGAHAPLDILSHDMFIIYAWLFRLRQKGMRDAYLIWEMGSFGINRSAVAFRNLVAELVKDTEPNNLPARFYGIDETIFAAQHNAIRDHGLDPLKGLIMVPEVDHGVFSKAAHEKGKAKEWEEEKYKY